MKKLILVLCAICLSIAASANPTPANSEKLLWKFSPASQDQIGRDSHATCATIKNEPYLPRLCYGEYLRADMNLTPKGYIKIQRTKNGPQETVQITEISAWKFLYRETQYVSNGDIYERALHLKSSSGKKSVLIEKFRFHADYDDYDKLSTISLEGTLPDGTFVFVNNIFFYYYE